jgi:hypothetical protein
MCRAGSAVAICFLHMEWKEDALRIYFAHQKNDQMGKRPRDPRHIYANPKCPEICPILSLGIYLVCLPPLVAQKKLFPGSSQYDRYRKFLIRHMMKRQATKRKEECNQVTLAPTRFEKEVLLTVHLVQHVMGLHYMITFILYIPFPFIFYIH